MMEKWLEIAQEHDRKDKIHKYRQEFYIGENLYYMDGNSLGLMSKRAEQSTLDVLNDWKTLAIEGWTKGERPWFYMSEKIGESMAGLINVDKETILATNSTTTNIHQTVRTLYQPTESRNKILVDELNFPSDIYAVQAVLDDHGYPDSLLKAESRDGHTLKTEDIIELMDDSVALILLPAVLYRSGQILDMEKLTDAAHEKGIIIGFDLCHSIGAIPHHLEDWDVDFAVWCTYKHLNGGPGSVAGLYVHPKHHHLGVSLKGWFGNNKESQFDMNHEFDGAPDISQYQIGTPHILSMAPLAGALSLFNEAGMDEIRSKSLNLTDFMLEILDAEFKEFDIEMVTPRSHEERGGHILIGHKHAAGINEALKSKGVIPDFRAPSYVRIAPVALYNTFEDVYHTMRILKEIMETKKYKDFDNKRGVVA